MGSMHTKAVEHFFCDAASATRGGFEPFKRAHFFGKYDWDEDAARKVKVPGDMCDVDLLFQM